jgi:hypothetical protein
MKRALIAVLISLFLLSLISARGLTSMATDDEEDNEVICCSITAVVPDAVPTYELLEKSKCDDVGDNGEPIVGAHKEIVDSSLCSTENEPVQEQNQIKNRDSDTITKVRKTLTPEQIDKIIQIKNRIQAQIKSGECPQNCTCTGSVTKCGLKGEREMTIVAGKSGNIIVQVKNVNASTKVTLYKDENGTLYGVFKNNETKEVRMLPDQVKEKIRERLSQETEDEEIELNEDGDYQYQGKKEAKLFGFIKVKEKVKAQVNAKTGEVIKLSKPWWSFLAKDDAPIIGASCGTVTPGYNDECCQNKGYDSWDAETQECIFNTD